ncbi:uncharacterized protein LOC116194426 [Punica granatum]|nr:uncharacterized protein LOC116194426 [Punica granatum]
MISRVVRSMAVILCSVLTRSPLTPLTFRHRPPPPMISAAASSLLVSLLLLLLTLASSSPPPFNASLHILQDVVKAISSKQKWDGESVTVSELDLRRARYGSFQRYDFRVQVGKADLFFKFSDDVAGWKKFRNFEGDLGDLVKFVSSKSAVGSFKAEGPLELRVDGDHDLSLLLPLNTTHGGLRRVFVSEGITVEVNGAREVFLFYEPDLQTSDNRTVTNEAKSGPLPNFQTRCMPLFPIHIIGPASVIAYRTRNRGARIETHSPTEGTIELLPEKCYSHNLHRKFSCPINSLSTRIATMERVLMSLKGDRAHQKGLLDFVKANIKASTYLHFRIQLERNLTATNRVRLDEWRTRPGVERVWFEVLVKLEGERIKPVVVKKVRPFIAVDTVDWNSLMSNVSFTKFPPVLVPPEALTLDVKW